MDEDYARKARIAAQKQEVMECCGTAAREKRPSFIRELHLQVENADTAGTRAKIALEFFGKHPEFAEFADLIRSGVIAI